MIGTPKPPSDHVDEGEVFADEHYVGRHRKAEPSDPQEES